MEQTKTFFEEYKRYLDLRYQARIYIKQQCLGHKESREARNIAFQKLDEEFRTKCEELGIDLVHKQVLITLYERISKLSQIKNSKKYLTEEEKELVDFFKNDKMYKELKNLFSNTSLNNVNKLFNIITTKHLDLDDILDKLKITKDNKNLICLRTLMENL